MATTMSSLIRAAPGVVFVLVALAASPAAGLPPPTPEAAAHEQFLLGREAFKAGDFARAAELFQASHRVFATTTALLNLALAQEKTGRLAEAFRNFNEVLLKLPEDDDRRAIAKERIAAILPQIGRLQLTLAPTAPAGAEIRVDGQRLAEWLHGTEIVVDPGEHVVATVAPGRTERRYTVGVAAGKIVAMVVETGPALPAAEATPPAARPRPEDEAGPSDGSVVPALIAFGLGVAAAATGTVTGALSLGKVGELEDRCPSHFCPRSDEELADEARTLGTISTVTFVVAGVASAAGVVLFLVRPGGGEAGETALLRAIPSRLGISF
jgi:tetratricopeptide (TPR) repeat protein